MRIIWYRLGHSNQRYDTIGDWEEELAPSGEQVLIIRTSILPLFESELLVFIHELVEALLCKTVGITQKQVDDFDMGEGALLDDPGAAPQAPYHSQHMIATILEKQLCRTLGIQWDDHDFHCQNPLLGNQPALSGAGLVLSWRLPDWLLSSITSGS